MIPARGLGRTFLDIRAWSYVSYRKEMMEEYRVYFYVVSVIGILAIYPHKLTSTFGDCSE